MPAYTKPFGFQPINLIGGRVNAGSTREIPMTANFGTKIRYGDLVTIASGVIARDTATTAFTTGGVLGIFLGCSYTDATMGKIFRQNWVASTVAADPVAIVCDDPQMIFRVAYVSSGTTVTGLSAVNAIGKNVAVVANTTSAVISDAAVGSVNTTSTLPYRVIDVDRDSLNAAGTLYTALLVTYNFGNHAYQQATGT
jgi:hypothetical protein